MTGPLFLRYRIAFLLLACIAFSCCSDDAGTNVIPEEIWELGPANTYSVESVRNFTVTDPATGVTLLFPDGGSGSVTIAAIKTPAEMPLFPGTGFMLELAGSGEMRVLAVENAEDHPMLFGWSQMDGAFDDPKGGDVGWYSVPSDETASGVHEFLIATPFQTGKANDVRISLGAKYYWYSKIAASTTEAEKRTNMSLQVAVFVDDALDRMSPALATVCRNRIAGKYHWRMEHDGNYYKGFWWRSLGAYGRVIKPIIHVRLDETANKLAHETAHYIIHLMVGDDVQSTLEGQSPLLPGHGLCDFVGRGFLLEDYAYFIQFLIDGKVESSDLHEPFDVLRDVWKKENDMPGIEGFTACMLTALTRSSPKIREFKNGREVHVPLAALSEADVCDIISLGATNVNQLVRNIESRLGSKKSAFHVLCQRLGWAYDSRGRFVDTQGQPLGGLRYRNVAIVDGTCYEAGISTSTSGSDGLFYFSHTVFPGNSVLRVSNGTDSVDVPIEVDWTKSTTESIVLGDVVVDFKTDLLSKLKQCNSVEMYTEDLFQQFDWPVNASGTSFWHSTTTMQPPPSWDAASFSESWTVGHELTRHIHAEFEDGGNTLSRIAITQVQGSGASGQTTTKEIVLKDLPAKYVNVGSGAISIAYQLQGKSCEEHAVKFSISIDGNTAPVTTTWSDRTILRVVFRRD